MSCHRHVKLMGLPDALLYKSITVLIELDCRDNQPDLGATVKGQECNIYRDLLAKKIGIGNPCVGK